MNNRSPIITGATADSVSIATKLDEARALIEKGWCQGAYQNGACYCVYGAINKVVVHDANFDWQDQTAPYERALARAINFDGQLNDWNDAPERTQAEVIEAFRKAADLARADAS